MRIAALGIGAFARAIGILVALAALVAAAFHLRSSEPQITVRVDSDPFAPLNDPLAGELARCRALGMAAVQDPACEAAWKENRRRFFGDAAAAPAPPPAPNAAPSGATSEPR